MYQVIKVSKQSNQYAVFWARSITLHTNTAFSHICILEYALFLLGKGEEH